MGAFLIWSGAALAGFHADIAQLEAEGPTKISVACDSGRLLGSGITRLFASGLGRKRDETAAPFLTVLSGEPGVGLFEQDGVVALAVRDEGTTLLVRNGMDVRNAGLRLGAAMGVPATAEGDLVRVGGFLISPIEGGVRLDGGGENIAQAAGMTPPVHPLIAVLPDEGEGCVVMVSRGPPQTADADGGFGPLTLFLPASPLESMVFFLAVDDALPDLSRGDATPVIRTLRAPQLWVTTSLNLSRLPLGDLPPAAAEPLRALRRGLPLAGGAVVAGFVDAPVGWAAVLPLTKPWPVSKVVDRIARLGEEMGMALEPAGVDRLQLTMDKQSLLVGAARGQLLLASSPELLADLERGLGQPWLDDEERETSKAWLLSAKVRRMPEDGPWALQEDATLHIGVDRNLVYGAMLLPLPPEGWAAALEMLAAPRAMVPE